MYTFGVSGGSHQGNQDASAMLLHGCEICAAVEEERISRLKNTPGNLPEAAIRFCLEQEGISIRDVDLVASPGTTYVGFTEILSGFLKHTFGHSPQIQLFHHHDCHGASASGFASSHRLSLSRYASPRRHEYAD